MTTMQRKSKRKSHRGRNGFLLAFGALLLIVLIALASVVGYVLAVANGAPDI